MIVGAIQMLLGGVTNEYWFGSFSRTAGGGTTFYQASSSGANIILSGRTNSLSSVFSVSNAGVINWSTSSFPTGSTDGSIFQGLFVSSANDIYVAGRAAAPASNNDISLAGLSSSGSVNFFRKGVRSGSAEEFLSGLAGDGTNLYATGVHGFSSGGSTTERDVYVAKYNTSGTLQWERQIGQGSTADIGNGIGIDSSANAYAVGSSLDGGSTNKCFIVKYNTSGTLQWQKLLADSTSSVFNGVAVSSTGDSYCVGYRIFTHPLIAKYNSSGTLSFQKELNFSSNYGAFNGSLVASDGFIYAVGYAQGARTMGLIAKYSTSGTLQWQRTIGHSSLNINLYSITVSISGAMYIAGDIGSNGFVASLPSDGTLTGTYGSYTYAASSYTDQSTSMTDSTPSFSSSTPSITYSSPSVTTASETLTVTKQTV